jgi:hypothetical protein
MSCPEGEKREQFEYKKQIGSATSLVAAESTLPSCAPSRSVPLSVMFCTA